MTSRRPTWIALVLAAFVAGAVAPLTFAQPRPPAPAPAPAPPTSPPAPAADGCGAIRSEVAHLQQQRRRATQLAAAAETALDDAKLALDYEERALAEAQKLLGKEQERTRRLEQQLGTPSVDWLRDDHGPPDPHGLP